MDDKQPDRASLSVVESVRCLECGAVYAKPVNGTAPARHRGCPECGYVGWISADVRPAPGIGRLRSAADRQQGPRAKSG